MLADHFIGQKGAITQLQTAIDACTERGTILPHVLLIAPPGVGKTHLAGKIAQELQAPFLNLTMPMTLKDLIASMRIFPGVMLLDEIHQADRRTLDSLLTFLVDGEIRDGNLTATNTRLTVVAATTDPQTLPDAFRSRFRVQPAFTDYTEEEMAQIISARYERDHHKKLDPEVCRGLAAASMNNPRQAIALMETYVDLACLRDDVTSDDVLAHLGYSRRGLRPDHLSYLEVLKKQGGVASQATIAQMVFMPAASLRWVERDLLRLGMISISSSGRELRSMDWEPAVGEVTSVTTEDTGQDLNPYTLEPR